MTSGERGGENSKLQAEMERLTDFKAYAEDINKNIPDAYRSGLLAVSVVRMGKALTDALVEIERLKAIVEAVDDVLICNWVGPRKDEDYRKALADLVSGAIREQRVDELEAAKQRIATLECEQRGYRLAYEDMVQEADAAQADVARLREALGVLRGNACSLTDFMYGAVRECGADMIQYIDSTLSDAAAPTKKEKSK